MLSTQYLTIGEHASGRGVAADQAGDGVEQAETRWADFVYLR